MNFIKQHSNAIKPQETKATARDIGMIRVIEFDRGAYWEPEIVVSAKDVKEIKLEIGKDSFFNINSERIYKTINKYPNMDYDILSTSGLSNHCGTLAGITTYILEK
ncbi:MAG: hypothetical protein H7296_15810 [Bacteroidia bacterium]|nr:hypothetical protein [Bacteroidia bacterium]